MLEESDQTHTNKMENQEWNEQKEIKKEELDSTTEKWSKKNQIPWRSHSPHKIQILQVCRM